MSNRLKHESSLYLRQHAENPVDWYPWGKEAFEKAKSEDKPVFLSIGYSTCHWCHVMAHESFEDEEIADILNRRFVCVKVDKEERPDVDSIYMNFAQAFTGSGGWPTSVFMTWDGKPFFAGTYFPRVSRYGMIGMRELLYAVLEKWDTDRDTLISQADEIIEHFKNTRNCARGADIEIVERAKSDFFRSYDSKNGGFGRAPKFPTPHNLLFLMGYYARYGDTACLDMVRHTLMQMYRGGIFDHFGYGFCRYSTDEYFLVPHFEKMLYDNALLILAYCRAHTLIKDTGLYLDIAEKTAKYILGKMTSAEGGFYTAEDADSEGEEGKYYVFTPKEITELLGERDGNAINSRYGITEEGNFEGKSIPNLLTSDPEDNSLDALIPRIEAYRRTRTSLHLDDKILTYPNSLMIAAMCELYRISSNGKYLEAARRADEFIKNNLIEDNTLYVSYRDGKRGVCGFLEDYAGYIFAQLALYRVTLDTSYIEVARRFLGRAISEFGDPSGGFYLYGEGGEKLILRPKVSYDGATPSGNSLIAYDMACLFNLTADPMIEKHLRSQLDFLMGESSEHPMGYAVFLMALLEYYEPGIKLTVVSDGTLDKERLVHLLPAYSSVIVLAEPTDEYPMKDGKTTYYLCQGHTCKPPTNDMPMLLGEGL